MSCIYLHYIIPSSLESISAYRNLGASGEIIHYLLKEIFLLFNYIQLECLKMNTLDMPQLKVCLMLLIGTITD